MSSQSAADSEREYRLIQQLELRIASANTEEKFQTVVQKFLAALVLKVGTENVRNRTLAIKICHHINQRLKLDGSISLPLQPLIKTFKESQSPFVSNFALIFIEQGLGRIPPQNRPDLLPQLLQNATPETKGYGAVQGKMWSVALDFLLDALRTWRIPDHTSKEASDLKTSLNLSTHQALFLSDALSDFIAYDLKTESSWKPIEENLKAVFKKHARARSEVIVAVAKFLFTSVFNNDDRLTSAILLSIDANENAAKIADTMFKQCDFDLEKEKSVDIFFNMLELDRPKLQIKVLSLLTKSQRSTERATEITKIVEKQLFRESNGLEAARLRAAVFQYLNWAVRVSNSLSPFRTKLQTTLREFIELQGWPTMSQITVADIDLRAKAYESIGLLTSLKSSPSDEGPGISMNFITWLFTSLRCDTTRDVKASIDEALSRILNVVKLSSQSELEELKSLLLWNVKAQEGDQDPTYYFRSINSTRYISLRFANKILPFSDVDARYIDVLALGFPNDRREVAEECTRGLDPYWHYTGAHLSAHPNSIVNLAFPKSNDFIQRTLEAIGGNELPLRSLTAAVAFGRNLLIHEALTKSHERDAPGMDWERALEVLTRNDLEARSRIKNYLKSVDPTVLVRLVESSILGMSLGSSVCANVAFDLVSLSTNDILQHLGQKTLSILGKASVVGTVQSQAARIFGILISLSAEAISMSLSAISKCSAWAVAVGQDMIDIQASLLCAGYTLSRMALRQSQQLTSEAMASLDTLISNIVLGTHDKSLRQVACTVLGQIAMCTSSTYPMQGIKPEIIDKIIADAKKEDEAAVSTLGRLVGAAYQQTPEIATLLLEKLYSLHEVRKPELHFALGEALATATLGFRSRSTLTEFDIDGERPHAGFHPELFLQVLDRGINDCTASKPSLRKASAIWLLSLVQYCDDPALLSPRLQDCQRAFAKLLNDRDEIVQETGSRGLSLVYEKGDKNLRDDLVRELVQSFTGNTAKMSGTVDEDTQLFEAGALPTEGGQSVQTYKDIVNLATEMGDPSLIYRFMNLASNNAIWSGRAAFGRFGLSGILADSTYLTENRNFYPKLFRYRFDPNPNVQSSMNDIWKSLVKDSSKVIDENFDLIMTDLLKSILSGRDWRAREASCAAISDLVQGRDVEKFEQYLNEIWNVAFKVLDDVKESVRIAAMKLCRTLTSMLIRNLEIGDGTTKRANTMLGHALPFLLRQMEGGSAQEVQQYAVITLLEVVKKCPLKSLQPFAPQILERLILSLSLLEHESINYLHLNADKYGLTAEKLDKMRVSSVSASPVSDAIERCLDSLFIVAEDGSLNSDATDGDAMILDNTLRGKLAPKVDAMQKLEAALKTAIGLPSKVGLSRVMITLVVRHHHAFRPYADRFLRQMRKYILDRNATISVSFSMAVGYLIRLASPREISETSQYAQKLYFESQELAHRAVAGEIVQAISKASNDVFMNFASTFLPFAFIGRNDLDAEVRNRFDPAWKDNVGGSRALNLYLQEIVQLVSQHIKSSLWPIKQASCLAVADLVSSMTGSDDYTSAEAQLLWPVVEESLNGKTWSGKEKVVLAYPKFVKRSRLMWAAKDNQMKKIALREAKRVNANYRSHALTALSEVLSTFEDLGFDQEVLDILTNIIDDLERKEDVMDVDIQGADGDGGETSGSSARHAEATISAALMCLFQLLQHKSIEVGPDGLERRMTILQRTYGKFTTKIDIEIYDGARQYITHVKDENMAQATNIIQSRKNTARSVPESGGSGGGGGSSTKSQDYVPPVAGDHQAERFNPVLQQQQQLEGFSHGLVLALFDYEECARRHSSDPETLRKSRAQLALALAESGTLNQPSRNLLMATVKCCLQGERSRPLTLDLERTLTLLAA